MNVYLCCIKGLAAALSPGKVAVHSPVPVPTFGEMTGPGSQGPFKVPAHTPSSKSGFIFNDSYFNRHFFPLDL